jgi:glutamine synthetase
LQVDGRPAATNHRAAAVPVFEKVKDQKPWWGMEQEYSLLTRFKRPLGWPTGGYPGAQGPYYCGNGVDRVFGRAFVEAHYKACLYAGIQVSGINAEVMPSQWEFQVGPVEGIAIGDQLWIARYIMHRLGELFRLEVSFDPKVRAE